MHTIRNTARYDLEVAGRVYPAGESVEVDAVEAGYLASNPNFQPVSDPPATTPDTERPKAGKKA